MRIIFATSMALLILLNTSKMIDFEAKFSVIRFLNHECQRKDGKMGTCYSQQECDRVKGKTETSARDICAQGNGICCLIQGSCGDTVKENNTYFEVKNPENNKICAHKICPFSTNICQIRIDFISVSLAEDDSFGDQHLAVQTGQHFYIDETTECIDLTFSIGGHLNNFIRQWTILVTQYGCDFVNRAPFGCDQFIYGQQVGFVQAYKAEQTICIRQERHFRGICYFVPGYDKGLTICSEKTPFRIKTVDDMEFKVAFKLYN